MSQIEKTPGNPSICPSDNCQGCESFEPCRRITLNSEGINNNPDIIQKVSIDIQQRDFDLLKAQKNY